MMLGELGPSGRGGTGRGSAPARPGIPQAVGDKNLFGPMNPIGAAIWRSMPPIPGRIRRGPSSRQPPADNSRRALDGHPSMLWPDRPKLARPRKFRVHNLTGAWAWREIPPRANEFRNTANRGESPKVGFRKFKAFGIMVGPRRRPKVLQVEVVTGAQAARVGICGRREGRNHRERPFTTWLRSVSEIARQQGPYLTAIVFHMAPRARRRRPAISVL